MRSIILRLVCIVLILSLVVSACAFAPVHDTRSPADATATNIAKATIEVFEATATEVVLVATLEATPAPECLIKGNINSKGEKIFHIPGSASYKITIVDPEHGEAWFCTEGQAIGEGFRKALR